MNQQDFSKAKVGDKLWCIQLGECFVQRINEFEICCENKDKSSFYYFGIDGKYGESDLFPSLFWSNPNIQIPERPKRKVTKTIEYWCNVYPDREMTFYYEKQNADKYQNCDRIACVKLTGTYEIEE